MLPPEVLIHQYYIFCIYLVKWNSNCSVFVVEYIKKNEGSSYEADKFGP